MNKLGNITSMESLVTIVEVIIFFLIGLGAVYLILKFLT